MLRVKCCWTGTPNINSSLNKIQSTNGKKADDSPDQNSWPKQNRTAVERVKSIDLKAKFFSLGDYEILSDINANLPHQWLCTASIQEECGNLDFDKQSEGHQRFEDVLPKLTEIDLREICT